MRAASRVYYAAHHEQARTARRLYAEAHGDEIRERGAAYRAAHRTERAARAKQYRETNAEKIAATKRIYRETHKAEVAEGKRRWSAQNAERRRDTQLRWAYGISLEEYRAIEAQQGGTCAICRRAPTPARHFVACLHVDHDHLTGRVRGLLCDACNMALGKFRDDPATLLHAYRYLRAAKKALGVHG